MRERERERGGREGGRDGGTEGGREREREGGREGERDGGTEGGREREREGGRKGERDNCIFSVPFYMFLCSLKSVHDTTNEEIRNSIPDYVNVEPDDGDVPMTTNPGYGQFERQHDPPRPLYANL